MTGVKVSVKGEAMENALPLGGFECKGVFEGDPESNRLNLVYQFPGEVFPNLVTLTKTKAGGSLAHRRFLIMLLDLEAEYAALAGGAPLTADYHRLRNELADSPEVPHA